jgi:alkylation response protein AidB-like acyl-CoA dehydrogenase
MNIDLDLKDPAWAEAAVQAVREIAAEHRELIDECQRAGQFPRAAFEAMGKRGLLGVITPPEFGGYGGDAPEYCLLAEAMARYDLVSYQIQIQGQRWLVDWGTSEQQQRYLPAGRRIACVLGIHFRAWGGLVAQGDQDDCRSLGR